MIKKPRITLVIPCRNEAKSIFALIDEVKKHLSIFPVSIYVKMLFIDDHSTDETLRVIHSATVDYKNQNIDNLELSVEGHALRHNFGKAEAQAFGIRLAVPDSDYLILMDADGQHNPGDLNQLLSMLLKTPNTYIGTRSGYRRTAMEKFLTFSFSSAGKILGINYQSEWCEFIAIPSSQAKHLTSLPELGIIPITSLVIMTYPETDFFETRVLMRLDGTSSSRFNFKSLSRKALMHLFCDPWTFFPRIFFLSTSILLPILGFATYTGIKEFHLGIFSSASALMIMSVFLLSIQILILNFIMGILLVFQKAALNLGKNERF